MRNPGECDGSLEQELVAVPFEEAFDNGSTFLWVPAVPDHRLAICKRALDVRICLVVRVAGESHVRRDAQLHQEHEEVAEAWESRLLAQQTLADNRAEVGHRRFTQHDE